MGSFDAASFRLAVLNPGGRDPEQWFSNGATTWDKGHPPVNFHAYAACTHGAVFREPKRAIETGWPVLLLLRGDFRATERALHELKRAQRTAIVALKETGAHQIARQLGESGRFARFKEIITKADGCIASTPEAAELFCSFRSDGVIFIPTPYPVDLRNWNCSMPSRGGIFVGTREFDVPSRNHLGALMAAKQLSVRTGERVTVFNLNGRQGRRLIAEIGFPKIFIREKRLGYRAYLESLAAHKIVFQLDRSRVPGQVAGDTILCRSVCVGGDGAVERIAYPDSCGDKRTDAELVDIALELLEDENARDVVAKRATEIAQEKLSFRAGRENLVRFFAQL